jgi:CHAT domain-containing protein/tetratricopeptide (TPR) repeat protein
MKEKDYLDQLADLYLSGNYAELLAQVETRMALPTAFQAWQLILIAAQRMDLIRGESYFAPFLSQTLEANSRKTPSLHALFLLSQGKVTIEKALTAASDVDHVCQSRYYHGCFLKTKGDPVAAINEFEACLQTKSLVYEHSLALRELRGQLWKFYRPPATDIYHGIPFLFFESQRLHKANAIEAARYAQEALKKLRMTTSSGLEFAMAMSDLGALNLRFGDTKLSRGLLEEAIRALLLEEEHFPGVLLGLIDKYGGTARSEKLTGVLVFYRHKAISLYAAISDDVEGILNRIKVYVQGAESGAHLQEAIVTIKKGIQLLSRDSSFQTQQVESRRFLVQLLMRADFREDAKREVISILHSSSTIDSEWTYRDVAVAVTLCQEIGATEGELDEIKSVLSGSPDETSARSKLHYRVATMYQKLGSHWKAIELLNHVSSHSLSESDLVAVNYALALSLRSVNDLALAKSHLEKCRASGAIPNREQVALLTLEAEIAYDGNDRASGDAALDKASQLPKTDETYLLWLNAVTGYYGPRGNYQVLGDRLEKALSAVMASPDLDHSLPNLLNNVGLAAMSVGDLGRAERFFGMALEEGANTTLLANYAKLKARMGDTDSAIIWFERTVEAENRAIVSMLAAASERQRLIFLNEVRHNFECYASLLLSLGTAGDTQLLLRLVLLRKGVDLELLTARRRIPEPAAAKISAILGELASFQDQMVTAAWSHSAKSPDENVPTPVNEKLDSLQREYAAVLAEHIGGHLQDITPALIAERLGRDEILIEYFVYHEHDFSRSANNVGPSRYAVATLQSGNTVSIQVSDLGEADTIDAEIRELLKLMNSDLPWLVGTWHEELNQSSKVLFEKLLRPIYATIRGATKLKVATDGQLSLLPFELLVDESGRSVADLFAVTYILTGRELLRVPATKTSGKDLVIANPDFELEIHNIPLFEEAGAEIRRSYLRARTHDLKAFLPGASREGTEIAKLLKSTLWHGRDALDRRVKQVSSPRILHFSTHGFFRDREQEAATGTNTVPELVSAFPYESGLVLAGANAFLKGRVLPDDAEDGFLFADEILAMDLAGTKLVTLSACETGLGKIMLGEGVSGLRRAFLAAGAESVVVTLWEILDEATVDLMKLFYANLLSGVTCGDSLRLAKNEMRKKAGCTPRVWAGFVCVGNAEVSVTQENSGT